MKKVTFVADFFNNQINGGAENNDAVLINFLRNTEVDVTMLHAKKTTPDTIVSSSAEETYIISNFIELSEQSKRLLEGSSGHGGPKKYIIYEHDHKYIRTRDPSVFPNFIIPGEQIINKSFYEKAYSVVVLSGICKKIMEKTLDINNVSNIGCSLWSDEKLDFIESLVGSPKKNKYCIINSPNPIKGTVEAVKYCETNSIEYDLIGPLSEEELLEAMAQYKYFIFMPQVLETLSRVVVEAKMLECKVVTRKAMIGATSEDWFDLSGKELIVKIRQKRDAALKTFSDLLEL